MASERNAPLRRLRDETQERRRCLKRTADASNGPQVVPLRDHGGHRSGGAAGRVVSDGEGSRRGIDGEGLRDEEGPHGLSATAGRGWMGW